MKFCRIHDHSFICDHLNAGSVVVDLGTNRGAFALEVSRRFGCRPFCAEPNPRLFEALAVRPEVRAFNVAIAPESGRACLKVAHNDECSSLFEPMMSGVESEVDCEALTFGDFLERLELGHVDLLKVDVEGVELDLLGRIEPDLLERINQLSVEFHDAAAIGTREDIQGCIRRVQGFGFDVLKGSFKDYSDVLFVHPVRLGLGRSWRTWGRAWTVWDGACRARRRCMAKMQPSG
jgi:FkbM family methyltransferase